MILGGFATTLGMTLAGAAAAEGTAAVLELFTSQGCSSCPPADALLGELAHRPDVIALAWHVDYWNSLGWRDPYATPEWTARQRAYAARLRADVFTPALVVDGAAMVVGSDRYAVTDALRRAQPLPVPVGLRRSADGVEGRVTAAPDGATAILVIYEAETATPVDAGENAGRRLREYRVVREMHEVEPGAVFRRPPLTSSQGAVLLLQGADLRVLGAAELRSV
jgi:hypothetical protein